MTGHPPTAPVAANPASALRVGLALTFLPLLWKAGTYAMLGSYVPLVAAGLLGALVASGFLVGGPWARWGVRMWCAAMIAWGVVRLLVLLLLVVTDLDEAHVRSQMSVTYAAVSAAYVVAGIVMWRGR